MNAIAQPCGINPTYSSSTTQLAEPFVQEMYEVFRRLENLIHKENELVGSGPTPETVEWAKKVLLRVLPRKFLIGAEINAFQREIHVTWENDDKGKRVVLFFPEPDQLKIYFELVQNDAVTEHKLANAPSQSDISDRLRWFFQ